MHGALVHAQAPLVRLTVHGSAVMRELRVASPSPNTAAGPSLSVDVLPGASIDNLNVFTDTGSIHVVSAWVIVSVGLQHGHLASTARIFVIE